MSSSDSGIGVAHRSDRVEAGAARHRAKRGCGLDPACPTGNWLAMRSAPCAARPRLRLTTVPGVGGRGRDGVVGDQEFAHDGGQRNFAGPTAATAASAGRQRSACSTPIN